jgi:hypothetical protein
VSKKTGQERIVARDPLARKVRSYRLAAVRFFAS